MRSGGGVRAAVIAGFLGIAVAGGVSLARRSDLGFRAELQNGSFVAVTVGEIAAAAGLSPRDRIVAIDEIEPRNLPHLRFLSEGLLDRRARRIDVTRDAVGLSFQLTPHQTHPPIFVALNLLLALTFIAVGLMVRWGGKSDGLTRSFYRLMAVSGVAILLFSHESWLPPPFSRIYATLWLAAYCFISPALVVFTLRLAGLPTGSRIRAGVYTVSGLIGALQIASYNLSIPKSDPDAILLFSTLFNRVFGPELILSFAICVSLILWKLVRSEERGDRSRLRWLLIITFAGLSPFFLTYKLPIILSGKPLTPIWAVFGVMLITPVGWGMTVASFRMFHLELTFKRTIVYTLSGLATLYLAILIPLAAGYSLIDFKELSPAMLAGGLLFLALGSAGLAGPVRRLVDRLYYRDWFDLQALIRNTSGDFATAVSEEDIASLLSERIAAAMALEKITLFAGDATGLRLISRHDGDMRSRTGITEAAQRLALGGAIDLTTPPLGASAARLAALGYERFLPLHHAGAVCGALLIGRKRSKAPFSSRDFALIDALTAPTAEALANLQLTRRLLEQEKRTLAADMAGGIAHEISNALAPMLGQAELTQYRLASGAPISSSEIAPALETIVEMSDRIRRIASNLNQLSKPLEIEVEKTTLGAIAREAVELMTETAGRIKRFSESDADAPYRLSMEINGEEVELLADRRQLGQVYMNLIINAADALESRGFGALTIGASRCDEPRGAIGFVADDGPGIPQALQTRIFQPYFTTKQKGKGTGLGLAIVRQIVESHGGWVRLESTEGAGARFEFFIPGGDLSE